MDHLKLVGLTLKQSKLVFMTESVEYLCHVIDKDGLHLLQEKLHAIQEAPEPCNIPELKSFLGLLNYYAKFVPNLANVLFPLIGCCIRTSDGCGLMNNQIDSLNPIPIVYVVMTLQ